MLSETTSAGIPEPELFMIDRDSIQPGGGSDQSEYSAESGLMLVFGEELFLGEIIVWDSVNNRWPIVGDIATSNISLKFLGM